MADDGSDADGSEPDSADDQSEDTDSDEVTVTGTGQREEAPSSVVEDLQSRA